MTEGEMGTREQWSGERLACLQRKRRREWTRVSLLTDWPLQTCPWPASWAHAHWFSEDDGITGLELQVNVAVKQPLDTGRNVSGGSWGQDGVRGNLVQSQRPSGQSPAQGGCRGPQQTLTSRR